MDDANLTAAVLLGYCLQWAKAPEKIPTWLAYVVFGVLAVAVFIWQEPNAIPMFQENWRESLSAFVGFLLSIEGVSAVARKSKAAPQTNKL